MKMPLTNSQPMARLFCRILLGTALILGFVDESAAHSDNPYSQAISACQSWIVSDKATQESYGNPVSASYCEELPGDWFATGYIEGSVVLADGSQTDHWTWDWYYWTAPRFKTLFRLTLRPAQRPRD
ncbi:hypothetical protein P3W24_18370 [Luteibacter sp. PPL201]|uniref:Uncharacterized protein n=1 Tax=Luteibacter sahnii TaxID=3021977 RepID=A0ABT6BFK3_9GAMM